MNKNLPILLLACLISIPSIFIFQIWSIDDVQQSHSQANTPKNSEFKALLERDLLSYFNNQGITNAVRTEYQLLKDTPTQSGMSYPRYYLWARVYSDTELLTEGAASVQAIEQSDFIVTDFLPISTIQQNTKNLETVFPAALLSSILRLAGAD